MFEIQRTASRNNPQKFIDLNNGYWYYHYNVVEDSAELPSDQYDLDSEVTKQTIYKYSRIRVKGKPTVDKCWTEVLKNYKDEYTTLYEYNSSPSKDSELEELISDIYHNVRVDFGLEEPYTELQKAKKDKIKEIEKYDTSADVNSFYLNGLQVWLNKDTRVGLMNSLTIEKNSGKEDSTLWFNDICITVKCDAAMQMLSTIELYALECYNKTAEHRVAVDSLTSIEAVKDYDYTAGYPEKLNFTIE